jgi:hypothetical protein
VHILAGDAVVSHPIVATGQRQAHLLFAIW